MDTDKRAWIRDVHVRDGDFVARDKRVEGDEVHGDKIVISGLGTKVPHQAPQLRDQYVERPAELGRLKDALLPAEKGARPPVSRALLHGIAAVGKSTLAAAFAHDEAVGEAFPDGVLWVTLGTDPDLAQRLADWGRALGDPAVLRGPYADEKAGTGELRSRLQDKACLLVVDDAWEPEHVEPFLVGGPRCLLLVTSRKRDVVRGATEIPLDVMREEEALKLMANWAGEIPEADRVTAAWLADELGYLPLALELAAAQVRNLGSWAQYRQRWEEHRLEAVKRGRRARRKEDSLRISLELSLKGLHEEDREPYIQLGVFPEEIAFPVSAAAALWSWDTFDAEEFLIDLAGQALLTPRAVAGEQRYTFHDVLYDFVTERLGEEGRVEAHAALVDGYRARCGGVWTELEPDGYLHDHLAWHMAGAGLTQELYALIDKPWMDVQFERSLSHHAFAEEVALAIGVSVAGESPNWLQFIRCSLIYATLGSLASSVPPEVLGVLGHAKQDARARGYAALIQDAETRGRAYRLIGEALLGQGRLDQARMSIGQAVAAAAAIDDPETRDPALGDLVLPMLGLGDPDQALLVASNIEDLQVRGAALVEIATFWILTRRDEHSALDAAVEVFRPAGAEAESDGWPIDIGVVIAAMNQAGEYGPAVDFANTLDITNCAFSTTAIARALLEEEDREGAAFLAEQAAGLSDGIEDPGYQVALLCEASSILVRAGSSDRAVAMAERALPIATGISNELAAPFALANVAVTFATAGAFARAVEATEAITEDWLQAQTLSEIAPPFALAGERARVLELADRIEVLSGTLDPDEQLASILCTLAQALIQVDEDRRAGAICQQVLAADDEVGIQEVQVEILQMLTRALAQAGAIDRALEVAATAEAGWAKARAMQPIIREYLTRREFDKAQQAAEALSDEPARLAILSEVALALVMAGDQERALAIADQVIKESQVASSERSRADAFSRWSRALAETGQEAHAAVVAHDALQVCQAIPDNYERAFALCGVVPALVRIRELDSALAASTQAVTLAAAFAEDETVVVRRMAQLMDWLDIQTVSGQPGPVAAEAILKAVVEALTQGGAYEQALSAVAPMGDEWLKAQALGDLLEALWQQADRDLVADIANRVVAGAAAFEVEASRTLILMMSILALARAGDLDGAAAVTRVREPPSAVAILLYWEADILADLGENGRALEAIDQALVVIEQLEEDRQAANALGNLARTLVRIGETNRAAEIASRALTMARSMADPATRADALIEVLPALVEAGMEEGVSEVTDEVMAAARHTEDMQAEAALLASFLQEAAGVEHRTSVMVVADHLLSLVGTHDHMFFWQDALSRVIRAAVQVGESARAREIAQAMGLGMGEDTSDPLLEAAQELYDADRPDLALSIVDLAEDEALRTLILGELSGKLPGAIDRDMVLSLIEPLWQKAEAIDDVAFQAKILLRIAETLVEHEENGRAGEFASRAHATAGAIDDEYGRSEALAQAARLLARTGHSEEAASAWFDALMLARLLGRDYLFKTLRQGADVLAQLDGGQTLWQVYRAMRQVDAWWGVR